MRQQPTERNSVEQHTPMVGISDKKLAQKVEDVLKWKLEASNRKLNDRVASLEEKQHQQRRMVEVVTNECHDEFQLIKSQILDITTDVLTQVQEQLLPQVQSSMTTPF